MIKGLDHVDPLLGVQGEHLAQEMDGLMSGAGWQCVQVGDGGWLRPSGQDVPFGGLAGELHVVDRRGAEQVSNELQLLDGWLGLKENSPAQKLAENAAHWPHVHGGGVVLGAH